VSYRPLVAIVAYHLAGDRVARWPAGGYGVPGPYIDALRTAGARTAIVSPGEPGDPEELLEPFDGLVLVGGGDVDPSRYGAEPDTDHLYGVETDRDDFEIALLLATARLKMPALCICRGMQVMNVAFGGTLHQHLPGMPGLSEHGVPVANTQTVHGVTATPGSRLRAATGVDALACSSHHHQGLDRVGTGLIVTGRSDDGLVEAIELVVEDKEHDGWMVGVQWHPEDTAEADPAQRGLFDGFALVAKWRGARAKPGETAGRSRSFALAASDENWPAWFEEEAERIRGALGDAAVRIDHVGSTSVPGLAAKPVIDIQVSVASVIPRAPMVAALSGVGYEHNVDPIDDEHDFFSKGYGYDADARRVHIHVCLAGGEWERRHLAFRDWLRAHPEDAAAYEAMKQEAVAAYPHDIYAYVDAKTAFIRAIEARALDPARRAV
jgi:putative glutamine amidotransferase